MEDTEDDFGDIYADVEVQANSAIKTVPGFSQLQIENENIVKEDSKTGELEKESSEKEDNGSDSDDDLKIVLNSDGCDGQGFQINTRNGNLRSGLGLEDEYDDYEERDDGGALEGKGDGVEQSLNVGGVGERGNGVKGGFHLQYSQYKYIRSQSTTFASNLKGNGCAAATSFFYSSGRGEREDNGFSQRMGPSSLVPKSGHNFSLPRSRTILDVNIDIFDQKPWKNPGADITDFFNFGFNEESWKLYCNQLDEYRHRAAMPTRTLGSGPFQLTEAYEGGAEHETVTQDAVGERTQSRCVRAVSPMSRTPSREQKLEMERGRAIQVEDSILERQPSMDVMRPVVRDSDVIQITVQDSGEHSSGSVKEDLGHIDGSVQEASENGDVGMDDDKEFLCFSSASEDELQSESLEGNHERMEISGHKRYSKQTTTSDPVSLDSESDERHQISDLEGYHYREVAICGSDGTDAAIGTSNNTKERTGEDTCTTDPSILGAESSEGEKSPASHCKANKDGAYIDMEKSYSHIRRGSTKSATKFRKSIKSDYYHSKDSKIHDAKRKPGDSRYYARHRSPACHYNRFHGVSKLEAHLENENSFPMLDSEGIYDVHLSTLGHSGQNEASHAFNSYDGKNVSYYKDSELPFDYYDERFSDFEVGDLCTRDRHRKGYRSSGKTGQYLFRNSDEEYFREQRRSMMTEEVIAKDWYHYERELAVENIVSFGRQESGKLNLKYPPYLEDKRGAPWKRKGDDLHFRKRVKDGDFSLEHRHTTDIRQGKYRRSLPYIDRYRDYVEHKYGKHVAYTGREVKSPGRNKRRYGSPSDTYWSAGNGDGDLRYRDGRSLTSHSFKEPRSTNSSRRGGSITPIKDVYERQGKYMRKCTERFRDNGSFGSYSDIFDTQANAINTDAHVNFGRRRYHWQSELQWNEDETISRRGDAKSHAEGALFSLESTSRHKTFDAEHGSDHVVEPVDGHHVAGCRYKQIRKGNNGKKFDRTSNIIHRGSHERPFLSYGDSMDSHLVVGEPKSSCRFHDRHDRMDWSIDAEQRTCKDFDSSRSEKIAQAEPKVEANEKNKEWLDKFPVPHTNEALDIEEGQIITEEISLGPAEDIYGSAAVAQVSDVKELPNKGYEKSRILQVMAKMEKRRERFKEPITLRREELDNTTKLIVDLEHGTTMSKQQRPARKRRWGGS